MDNIDFRSVIESTTRNTSNGAMGELYRSAYSDSFTAAASPQEAPKKKEDSQASDDLLGMISGLVSTRDEVTPPERFFKTKQEPTVKRGENGQIESITTYGPNGKKDYVYNYDKDGRRVSRIGYQEDGQTKREEVQFDKTGKAIERVTKYSITGWKMESTSSMRIGGAKMSIKEEFDEKGRTTAFGTSKNGKPLALITFDTSGNALTIRSYYPDGKTVRDFQANLKDGVRVETNNPDGTLKSSSKRSSDGVVDNRDYVSGKLDRKTVVYPDGTSEVTTFRGPNGARDKAFVLDADKQLRTQRNYSKDGSKIINERVIR